MTERLPTLGEKRAWLRSVMADPDLPPAAKIVAWALVERHNTATGKLNPRVETIASDSGLSDRGTRLALAALETGEWICRVANRRIGRSISNSYALIISAGAQLVAQYNPGDADGVETRQTVPAFDEAKPEQITGFHDTQNPALCSEKPVNDSQKPVNCSGPNIEEPKKEPKKEPSRGRAREPDPIQNRGAGEIKNGHDTSLPDHSETLKQSLLVKTRADLRYALRVWLRDAALDIGPDGTLIVTPSYQAQRQWLSEHETNLRGASGRVIRIADIPRG